MSINTVSWKKTFFIIFFGQAFSMLTTAMSQFGIMWYITDKTASPTALTFATIAGFAPQAFLGPFIGTLVDKYDRKLAMIFADLFIALVSLALAGFFFMYGPNMLALYIALALRSVGTALHTSALQSSMPMLAPQEELTRISGWHQFVLSGSNLLGPALGIILMNASSLEYLMIADAVGATIAISCLFFVTIPRPEHTLEDLSNQGMIKEMIYGIKVLREKKGIFILTILMTMITFIFFPTASIYPIMIKSHFMGNGNHAAVTESLFGAGMIAGALALSRWGTERLQVFYIAGAYFGSGLFVAGMGLLPPNGFSWFLVLSFMLGVVCPFMNGPYMALLQTYIEAAALGRVVSLTNSMTIIATPVGLLAAGPLAQIIGVPLWMAIAGAVMALLGFSCFFVKIREEKAVNCAIGLAKD